MTTISKNAIRLAGLSLIAAFLVASHSVKAQAKEICFEECTFEMMGNCWRWKKACLALEVNDKGDAVASQRSSRQNIPNQIDSLLLGGGLTTALDNGSETKSFGNFRGSELMH